MGSIPTAPAIYRKDHVLGKTLKCGLFCLQICIEGVKLVFNHDVVCLATFLIHALNFVEKFPYA